jgi:hypothetical protein
MKMLKFNIFLAGVISVISSCGIIKPQPPMDMNAVVEVKPLPVVVSQVNIPLEIDLMPFLKMADDKVDKTFSGQDKPCQGLRYEYKLNRSPFIFEGRGIGQISMALDLQYGAKGEYCPLCIMDVCATPPVGFQIGMDEPMKRARIGIESKFKILPTYKIQSVTTIQEVKPIDPIKVLFGFDVTNLLLNRVKPYFGELSKMVDKEIAKVDLKPFIKPVFDQMQKDIFVPNVGYLKIQPKELSLSDLSFNKSKLSFSIGLKATPAIQSTKWTTPSVPLPNLAPYKASDGFQVFTDVSMNYDSLSKQIMGYLKTQKFVVGKDFIIIQNIRLFAAKDKLGVEVAFIGSKSGTLYLLGNPAFDSDKKTVSVKNVEYDLSTKNLLLKSAKWMLNETIRKKMEEAMVVDITSSLNSAEKGINESLNKKLDGGITLKGNMKKLNITDISPREKEILVRVSLSGNVGVTMNQ